MSHNHSQPDLAWPERWPHRVAVLLVGLTFPLIWVGGLVTSYDAGMAVPDWPSTYGYNLFLYPWQTWLFGPFDILVEHGHRLLASLVGFITIALLVSIWKCSTSPALRVCGVIALGLVVGQGVLGGMRVLFDERDLAKVHGCVGPLFFAFTCFLATFTSRRWRETQSTTRSADSSAAVDNRLFRFAALTAGWAYLQIALGAQLRHLTPDVAPGAFRALLLFHLVVAAIVTSHLIWLAIKTRRATRNLTSPETSAWLTRPTRALVLLVVTQLTLGAATWVLNYGFPIWFRDYAWAQDFVIQHESFRQALVSTAHVAIGALIFALSTVVAARVWRTLPATSNAAVLAISLTSNSFEVAR